MMKEKIQEKIQEKLAVLPSEPGCYLMKDKNDTVIYVGKSKALKNRVRSYFIGANDKKTQRLVMEIVDFEYIVTNTEVEALILELNLIKKYDPKYNIMLKDDKSYPYLKITNERHPRLLITRKIKKDKAKYFGPYPNVIAARETKRLLDRLYPLRKCNNKPGDYCLYYHLGQCLACSKNPGTKEQYNEIIREISRFLQGAYKGVKNDLITKMNQASEQMDYERAIELRESIKHIEALMEQQKVVLHEIIDIDIFGYSYNQGWMCVQVFYVRQGKLIERDVSIFPFYQDSQETFISFVGQFYLRKNNLKPKQILLPVGSDADLLKELLQVDVHTPLRGKKKDLVELAIKNADISLTEQFSLIERDEERTIVAVENLGKHLNIETPHHIEAFDNSNIQGVDPVSAMVKFVDGKADKNGYRKYKIKTVSGPDDYETMREVIRRRYSRVLKEKMPLPDLIIVDGGKGQMSAALEVLELELGLDIPVCGLIKDERHSTSELIYGDPPEVISLKRDSNEFYLVQRIQDEVHRFAITFHRQLRSKGLIQSELDKIPEIGKKRLTLLLSHFKSIKAIKNAKLEEITALGIPENVAKLTLDKLNE